MELSLRTMTSSCLPYSPRGPGYVLELARMVSSSGGVGSNAFIFNVY